MPHLRSLPILLATLLGPLAGAQERSASASVELGGAGLRQPGGGWKGATSVGVRSRVASTRTRSGDWSLGLDAAGTLATDSVSAVQGIATLSWAPPARALRAWRTEVAAGAARFDFQQVGNGDSRSVTVRQHWEPSARGGAWLTADRGWSNRQGLPRDGEAVGLTGWRRVGPAVVWGGAARTWTTDVVMAEPALWFLSFAEVRFDDLRGGLTWSAGRAELTASGVVRRGTRGIAGEGGDVRLGWRLTPTLTLEASHARQLGDPVRATPEARLSMLSLRAQGATRVAPVSLRELPGGGAALVVRARGEGPWEVAGSFNDWTPVGMTRVGRAWEATVRVAPGVHQVAVRRGGGPWRAPAGLPRARDEFSGEHGVLVVP